MYRYRLCVYFLASLAMYVFAPDEFNYNFCLVSSCLYLLIGIDSIFQYKNKTGWLNFSVLFTFFLFVTSFLIPLVLYSDGAYTFFSSYICKATSLCSLALCAYYMGRRMPLSKSDIRKRNFRVTRSMVTICNVLTIGMMILYLISFRSFLSLSDSSSNDIQDRYWVTLLFSVPTLSLLLSTVYNRETIFGLRTFVSKNMVSLISITIAIISSLYIGDRTIPLYLSFCILFVYIMFIKPIRPIIFLSLVLSAGLLFYIVGQTRKGDNSIREAGIAGVLSYESSENNFIDYFADFYPSSEASYLFVQWRENRGEQLYYPGKFFIYLVSPIPFLPSFLAKAFYGVPFSQLSSGYLSTAQYNKYIRSINGGIGTHAVGDIYVSWGLLGVIALFYLLGVVVGSSFKSCQINIFSTIVYMSLFADAIYMARASLFDCYRTIVFQILLYLIIKKISANR